MARKVAIRCEDGYHYVAPNDVVSVTEVYTDDLTEVLALAAGYETVAQACAKMKCGRFTVVKIKMEDGKWRALFTTMSPEDVAEEIEYASDMNKVKRSFLTASTVPLSRMCIPLDEIKNTEEIEVEEVIHVKKKRVLLKSGDHIDFVDGTTFREVVRVVDKN